MRGALVLTFAACAGGDPAGKPVVVCGDGVREEFEDCDDGNRNPGDGCDDVCQPEPLVTVTWSFFPMLGGPAETGCRAGVVAIELVTEVSTTARFPCNDTHTGAIFVPPIKKVFARLRGPADEILTESLPAGVPSSWRIDAPFYEDAGYLRASLPLRGTCASVSLTLVDGGGARDWQSLPCRDGITTVVVSEPIRAGTYHVEFQVGGETFRRAGVVVGNDNRVTELGF